jgi:hypothetical protein
MIVGGLIMVASVVRGISAYRRFFRTRSAPPGDKRQRAIAGGALAYSEALNLVIFGGGLFVLMLGAMIESYLQARALLAPIGLIVGGLVTAQVWREAMARLRNSA